MRCRWGAFLALVCVVLMGAFGAGPARAAEPLEKVLVFSKTAGFRHGSIPQGIAAVQSLGAANGFAVDATEDGAVFTDANLAQYDVIVFMSTTGDILDADQQAAFERYMRAGGGFAGVHAASDTEYTWPYYGQMLGGYFRNHPPGSPQATVHVEDADEPSTAGLPAAWVRNDEWYNFQKPKDPVVGGNQAGIPDYSPRTSGVHVLATVDESTYDERDDSAEADDHPIAWCSDFDGGRVWYTAMGHTAASFSEPDFLKHLLGGLRTAARSVDADCGAPRSPAPTANDFELTTLAKGLDKVGEPISLAVLPDRRVLHTSRNGRVWLTTPNATTTLAAQLNVYSHDEDGLQGVAVDPDFETNRWVYLFYAPRLSTPLSDAPVNGTATDFAPYKGHNQLSRFKLGEDGKLDLASEQKILEVPADRGQCCHVGGDIDFDAQSNLYLSTGDDTNPFQSNGYSPIDERPNRNPVFDAQRTSANTNDLRGKLLRITVQADGSYTIPAGNLFAPGTMGTKPEIYAMGFRNPFRFGVDHKTGWVYLGEYGPDAGAATAGRGPGGQVEFNLIKEPGNYGWPYCTGKSDAYNDWDFATGTGGALFDCAAPKNESPHNTGLTDLPAAVPAWIAYNGNSVPEFGSGSESPMGGPTYHFDPENPSETKFPAYFDGKNFAYEFGRAWIKTFTGGGDGSFPEVETYFGNLGFKKLIDLQFGPDGALYVLDYGSGGNFSGDENSAVYRIDYVRGERKPIAAAQADRTSGPAPLTVKFSSEGSIDPDGTPVTFAWDFDGDGTTDSTAANPEHTYTTAGRHTATLKVTDAAGDEGNASINLTAGNTAPTVKINLPAQGAFFDYGDKIKYTVTVTDPEDGEIDCSKVLVNTALGHNDHSHGDQSLTGCSGEFTIPGAWEDKTQHIWYIVSASYTDETTGLELTGTTQMELEWKTLQAEQFDAQSGLQTVNGDGAAGGVRVGHTAPGDWLRFDDINLSGIDTVTLRTSGNGASGHVELRADSPSGPLVATVPVLPAGGWEVYRTQEPAAVTDPGGTRDLYLVVVQSGLDIDELTFDGPGATGNASPDLEASATPISGAAPLKVDFTASAVDPEGTAVSFRWDFGVPGAPAATTADASFTYVQRGRYTATVTATDADGRTSERSFVIEALGTCPGTDTFTGTALDRTVWPTIVRHSAPDYRVADGVLTIDAVAGNMWTSNKAAKNIISRPLPNGPWTATTKVTLDHAVNNEQAAILLRQNDNDFYKVAWIRGSGGRNVEFVGLRNNASTGTQRSAYFAADASDTVWLRLSSTGTSLSAAYSVDGQEFTPIGTPKPLDRMPNPQLGISAFNGTGTPATFEWFNLTASGDDAFDDDVVNECRWTTLRPQAGGLRVRDGELQIDTLDGDQHNGTSTAKNVLLQPAPTAGRWEATTKVKLAAGSVNWEQAGLLLFADDDNFAKVALMEVPNAGWQVEFGQDVAGRTTNVSARDRTATLPAGLNEAGVWLKLVSDGTSLTAAWSADGETWTPFSVARSAATMADAQIGLAAYHGNGQPGRFAHFELNRAPVLAEATGTPTAGTAPLVVQFDAAASDADGDELTYAWDFDGDGTVDSTAKSPAHRYDRAGDYAAKVTISDGSLEESRTLAVTVEPLETSTPGDVGGEVPPTLSLQLGAAPSFGAFVPGVARDYEASTTATVVSTAGDAAFTVTGPARLTNGSFSLEQPLRVRAGDGAWSGLPATLRTYAAPVSNDVVPIEFQQSIGATDPLRTGTYSTTVQLTLSTTTP